MKPNQQFLFAHPAHFIAFGFGAGLMKKAPGTWGTLVALPLFFALQLIPIPAVTWGVIVLLFAIGCWASAYASKSLGVADHGGIVIDEIVAFMLVLAFTPMTWIWVLAAFALFRFFDIVKPWPISLADKKIKGGFGVMFDDLLAALFVIVCVITIESLLR
jgi:phosphatidylglycerophosphatase A